MEIEARGPAGSAGETATLHVGDRPNQAEIDAAGSATFANVVLPDTVNTVSVEISGQAAAVKTPGMQQAASAATVRALNGCFSIVPPVVAIGLALLTRQVIPSLLAGAWFHAGLGLLGLWTGLLDVIDTWILRALVPADGGTGHISIVLFTMLIGGMVGIVYRIGGATALVHRLTLGASTRRPGEAAAAFFDDYSSLLITGDAVRPIWRRRPRSAI